jgi:hypothetical protein
MKTLALASSLAFVVACTTDNKDSNITQDEYDDVAQSVGASTATSGGGGDAGAMADVVLIAKGGMPLGFTVNGSGSIVGTHLGLDYSYMLTCKDAAGTTLVACGPTTDSADASLMWSGNLSLPNLSTSVTRDGSWSVSGLQGTTATFNGNGSFTYDAMISNPNVIVTTAYHFDYNASYDAVLVDTSSKLATGGSVQYEIDASKAVNGSTTQSFSLTADVTFNADSTATIVLDGTHEYSLNVATGVVVSVSN